LDPKLITSKSFNLFLRIPVPIFWGCICSESLLPIRGLVTLNHVHSAKRRGPVYTVNFLA
jgi:hypothetical protein